MIESDLANGLLAQLEPLGLVGLGLMPGSLRYPMSTGVPLTTPADWVGQPFYTFESQVGMAAVVSLGADPQHVGFDERDQGLADGSIIGFDNGVAFQADRLNVLTHLVADVPFTTRMSALVAGPAAELNANERRWIAEAVADTAAGRPNSARSTERRPLRRAQWAIRATRWPDRRASRRSRPRWLPSRPRLRPSRATRRRSRRFTSWSPESPPRRRSRARASPRCPTPPASPCAR